MRAPHKVWPFRRMSILVRTRLWLLCVLLAALFPAETRAVEKIIRHPIHTSYTVHDPAFQESIIHHLHAPLIGGNKITELINGVEFYPEMLKGIRNASNTITFENFIWYSGNISD